MIRESISLSDMASLITAVSILMGVVMASLVVMRIFRQQEQVKESLRSIEGREFFSKEEAWRSELEKRIADLSERLTERPDEFSDINHLIVDADRAASFSYVEGSPVRYPILSGMDIPPQELERGLIFVLTPFETREDSTYAAIVEAVKSWNVKVLRGDEEKIASNILRHIVTLIARADIVIANVSTRNPNVMYELGIAHALGKRVILVSRTIEEVPFDLKNQRILLYSSRDDLISKLRESVGGLLLHR